MQDLNTLKSILEKYREVSTFSRHPKELYDPANYIMGLGGKRMRPLLVLAAYQMFRASQVKEALPLAYAVEVFHNFTLVHDDIMDDAPIRRGQPTVHTKWDANTAILSGDVMLIAAYESLMQFKGEAQLPRLIRVFNRVAREVCEGQQMDMNFENDSNVTIDNYLRMIELKTAVLLGGSLEMGAIGAGAKEEDIMHLSEFGRFIGIAFQLQDDLLDTFGDSKKFGKKIGGDIVQNKKTFLILKAYELGDPDQVARLKALMQTPTTQEDEKIKKTTGLLTELEIPHHAAVLRDEYRDKAFRHLEQVDTRDEEKQLLYDMTEWVISREK